MTGPVIPMVAFIIMCGFTFFYLLKLRHVERMTRIEHGMPEANTKTNALRSFGLFLIFLALGLFTAYITSKAFNWPDYIFIPGFLLLFGGMGLVVSHFLNNRK